MNKTNFFISRFYSFLLSFILFLFCFSVFSDHERSLSFNDKRNSLACFPVKGSFSSVILPPSRCTSPVNVCTEGVLKGSLHGTYNMFAKQMFSTGDPLLPFVNFFLSTSTIILSDNKAVIIGIDTGSINNDPNPSLSSGQFSSMLNITEGGDGYLFINGHMSTDTGKIEGTYTGIVCF